MAITDLLGTDDSQLGNMSFGLSTVYGGGIISRSLTSTLALTQTLSRATTRGRSASNVLTLTSVIHRVIEAEAENTLTLTHYAARRIEVEAESILSLSGSASAYKVARRTVSQALALRQTLTATRTINARAANVLGLSQSARGKRVYEVSVSNTLNLSQDLVRTRVAAALNSLVALSQSLSAVRIIPVNVSNQLHLSQSMSRLMTYGRILTNAVEFKSSFEKNIAISSHQTITVPIIQAVKIKRLVILRSNNYVITLPPPEFNDKEGGTGRINIKRAMDGTRRVYKRNPPASKLTYDFVIDRLKAIELRQFILANNSSLVYMENWKGELWAVLMTNASFVLTEVARWNSSWGNKSTVTLEFEGVRYA